MEHYNEYLRKTINAVLFMAIILLLMAVSS